MTTSWRAVPTHATLRRNQRFWVVDTAGNLVADIPPQRNRKETHRLVQYVLHFRHVQHEVEAMIKQCRDAALRRRLRRLVDRLEEEIEK